MIQAFKNKRRGYRRAFDCVQLQGYIEKCFNELSGQFLNSDVDERQGFTVEVKCAQVQGSKKFTLAQCFVNCHVGVQFSCSNMKTTRIH